MIKLPSGIEQIWQHWNLPLVLLLLSQENGHTKQLPKQSQGQCSPAALLWLLLLIMHKFFELSRSYGFPDVLVSLACLRWSLPLLIWSYVITITTATWQQTESPKASGAAHHRAERIIHGNVYLCNTHSIMCDQRAGARPPTTQCGYLQPAEAIIMTILLRECLKGGRCQAHTLLSPSHGWQEGHNLSATPLA